MLTVKIIHYPEGGNKTTEVFETSGIKVTEGYLHELTGNKEFDGTRTFGCPPNKEYRDKSWCSILYVDQGIFLCNLNAEVYIMSDGKTVASYKSILIT
jgi:cobalamin biosynthesis Mg chelatase CobN